MCSSHTYVVHQVLAYAAVSRIQGWSLYWLHHITAIMQSSCVNTPPYLLNDGL